MNEYMLFIRNHGDIKNTFSPDKHSEFIKKCEVYIKHLKREGKLISAQPLVDYGKIISGSNGTWKEIPLNEKEEMQVGYYHIFARNIDEAVAIAKQNPEFEYTPAASIEVRPIKTKEEGSGFVYSQNL
jgi:hypothetical protein